MGRKVVILSVPVKGSGVASLVTMAQGESRPVRAVRWGGRVWWVASHGVTEGHFNTPLPSIVDGTEARQRGFRICMGIQALGCASLVFEHVLRAKYVE
jgi:hypothetical protein